DALREGNRLLGVDRPLVKDLRIPRIAGERVLVGQSRAGILGGVARDLPGGLHRLAQGRRGEIGGARVPAALADVDRDAEGLVAVLLERLDAALADVHRQPAAFGELGRGIARAELAREGEYRSGDLAQRAFVVFEHVTVIIAAPHRRARHAIPRRQAEQDATQARDARAAGAGRTPRRARRRRDRAPADRRTTGRRPARSATDTQPRSAAPATAIHRAPDAQRRRRRCAARGARGDPTMSDSPNPPKIGLVSVSDRASQGVYADQGVPGLQQWLESALVGAWQPVVRLIPDERETIERTLVELVDDERCSLVLTTGGTGPAPRDVTPDATLAVGDREMPGFGEQMRQVSLHYVPT